MVCHKHTIMCMWAVALVVAHQLSGTVWAQVADKKSESENGDAAVQVTGTENGQPKETLKTEQKPEELEEITITATRTSRTVKDVPASVSVITREDLQSRKVQYLDEAVKYTVGVLDRRRKPQDTLPIVSMRGIPGGSRNLVLLDGVPLNTAYTGDVQWSGIPVDFIERIEVVRGPQSALYGGAAMGGVINIITRTPKQQEFHLKGGYGSFDTWTGEISYGNRFFDKISLFVDYNVKYVGGYRSGFVTVAPSTGTGTSVIPTHGFRPTTDTSGKLRYIVGDTGENWWKEQSLSSKISLDVTTRWNVSFAGIFTGYDYGYDRGHSYLRDATTHLPVETGSVTFPGLGPGLRLRLSPGSFQGGFGSQDQNIYIVSTKYTAKSGADLKATLGIVDVPNSWWTIPEATATWAGGPGSMGETVSTNLSLDLQSNIPIGKRMTFTVGGGVQTAESDSKDYELINWRTKQKKPFVRENEGKSVTFDVYAQQEYKPWDPLRIYVGARYDHWTTYDGHSFVRNYEDREYPTRSEGAITPKAGVSLDVLKGTTLRAAGGMAFRPPTVYELYRTYRSSTGKWTRGNPNLTPESEIGWEIGVDQELWKGTKISATYFDTYLKDLIYLRTVNPTLSQRDQAESGRSYGVELELRSRVTSWLDVFANYSHVDSRIVKNPGNRASEGKFLPMMPADMVNFGVEFKRAPFGLTINAHYQGKMYGTDTNTDRKSGVYGSYDPFFVVDAKFTYDITKNVRAMLAIDNLFNEKYYQYNLAPGIGVFGGLEIKF